MMKFLHWLRKFFIYKVFKKKTLGVRTAIFDENKVLLVKHRYNNFWVFPGGAVKRGELRDSKYIEDSAVREAREEVLIEIQKPLIKFSEYQNNSGEKNDTVLLYIAEKWKFINNKKHSLLDKIEISESQWFDVNDLPQNISEATKNRIFEIISFYNNKNIQISQYW